MIIAEVDLEEIKRRKLPLMIELRSFSCTSIHQQHTPLQACNSIVINNSLMSSSLIHNKFWGLIACYGFDLDHSLWSMKRFLQVTRMQQINYWTCAHRGLHLFCSKPCFICCYKKTMQTNKRLKQQTIPTVGRWIHFCITSKKIFYATFSFHRWKSFTYRCSDVDWLHDNYLF